MMAETIEGRNPLLEALKADRPIGKILLDRNIKRQGIIAEILGLAESKDIPVEFVPGQVIERQSATGTSQGVIGLAAEKEYISLDDLLAVSSEKKEPPLYCVLDGMEDPRNLGAIIRTAEATGVHGIVIRSRRAVGLTPAVSRASAGAIEYVPVCRVTNISQAIEELKKNGIWVVGIDMDGELQYTEVDFKPPTAIVIGGEGKGLSALVKQRCDSLAYVPMKGKISSLNASVAAAVVMYEVVRQRT